MMPVGVVMDDFIIKVLNGVLNTILVFYTTAD